MSRHAQRFWKPKYKATHVSVEDGSPAMLVRETQHLIVLMNEDGNVWTDRRSDWQDYDDPARPWLDEEGNDNG